nr:hypothetical protein [uncultured Desulfuromonas sp.]
MNQSTIQIPINAIRQHKGYQPYSKTLAQLGHLLSDPTFFTKEGLEYLCLVSPVIVIKNGRYYHYVSGYRTYTFAAQLLCPEKAISVQLLKGLPNEKLNHLICGDIFLSPLANFHQISDFGHIFKMISNQAPELLQQLITPSTQKELCAALDCAYGTLFNSKTIKKGPNK